VNFADGPVHDLLIAYEAAPRLWGDDLGLPESGNCVPDLLDEVRWELDWFLRMQGADGSVLHKVSVTTFDAASPPSADAMFRRHAPATASATVSACGLFAHAARVFASLANPAMQAEAARYEAAARAAWAWLEANPGARPSSYDNAGFVNAAAEDGPYEQAANRVCAASYLFSLTGEARFRAVVDAEYRDVHLLTWTYAYPFEMEFQDCLLDYASRPDATPAVASAIRSAYTTSMQGADNLGHHRAQDDAYRAWLADADYVWGSNRTKAYLGLMFLAMNRYGLDPGNAAAYAGAAATYAHYLHGVNPLGLVMLTNMAAYGAESSAQEIYHSWFGDGTDWDSATTSLYGPAPGFVPGGINPNFQPDPTYAGPPIEPPQNQPILKSYLDWNTSWPENSWQVTENSITYQAAYVRLLAGLVAAPPPPVVDVGPIGDACDAGKVLMTSLVAGGSPPYGYQWTKDASPLVDDGRITGAQSDALSIDPVASGDTGLYALIVTDARCEVIASASQPLSITALPGSPGASLMAVRRATDVELSWSVVVDADGYDLLRCDAGAAACTPVTHAQTSAPRYLDPADPVRSWRYQVEAYNACGSTP